MKHQKIKLVTGTVRFESIHLDPDVPNLIDGLPFNYSISLAIPKKQIEDVNKINQVIEALKKDLPTGAHGGLMEGADPECWYLTAASQQSPGLVDYDLNPIIDRSEVYAGCTGRVSITVFTFEVLDSFGVAFGLNNIMKQSDGSGFLNSTVAQEFRP